MSEKKQKDRDRGIEQDFLYKRIKGQRNDKNKYTQHNGKTMF